MNDTIKRMLTIHTSEAFYIWINESTTIHPDMGEFSREIYEQYIKETGDDIKIRTFYRWLAIFGEFNGWILKRRLSNGKTIMKYIISNKDFPKTKIKTSSYPLNRNLTYSQKHDLIILKWIEKRPDNIKYALEQASEELERPYGSVTGRYYSYIKKKYKNTITCGSRMGATDNVKNSKRDLKNAPNDPPKQSLQPWLSVIHIYMDLPKEQQQALKTLLSTL